MTEAASRNHWPTVAALSVLAMCLVTFDHEALGHGSACAALHGHILVLTSSIFRCDAKSGWIDPAGPATSLLMGVLALALARLAPRRRTGLRFFLTLVTAFSFFWETGYLAQAMLKRHGDLYFFATFLSGEVGPTERWVLCALGLALYLSTAWLISDQLSKLWPQARVARSAARTAWLWATLGSAIAAIPYAVHDLSDLHDAALQIGGASLPLLIIPRGGSTTVQDGASDAIERSYGVIALAVIVYVVFVGTMGRGLAY
jgi:hypothetical protein